jgi:hypothetical protein
MGRPEEDRGRKMRLKTFYIPLMISIAGCMGQDLATPAATMVAESQAVTAQAAIAKADEMAAPPAHGHRPPVPGPTATEPASREEALSTHCPQEKVARPDWQELALAKARLKAEAPRGLETPAQVSRPPAELLEKQARFLEVVKEEGFTALPPEQRDMAYAQVKRNIMGE